MKRNLKIFLGVSILMGQVACMRSGQTVRWIKPQTQDQAVWVGCQNLQEEDQVLAIGGDGENIQCQILSSEESPGAEDNR